MKKELSKKYKAYSKSKAVWLHFKINMWEYSSTLNDCFHKAIELFTCRKQCPL